jgi:hypothetical protein
MKTLVDRSKALGSGAAIALLAWLASAPLLASDSVQLQTGELFFGSVLRVNPKEVSIRLESGGILTFKSQQVKRVRRWVRGKDVPEVIDVEVLVRESAAEAGEAKPEGRPGPKPAGKAADDPSSSTSSGPVVNTPMACYFAPPPGFRAEKPPADSELVEVWSDPVAKATVTLAAYPLLTTKPERLRKEAIEKAQTNKDYRVIRDQEVQRGGEGGYRGWILEIEHSLSGKVVRQIQLFTSDSHRSVFVLTCVSGLDDYPSLARFFDASMDTFRIRRLAAETPPKPAKAIEPIEDDPPAVPQSPLGPSRPRPPAPKD